MDIYTERAAMLFGVKEENVTPEQRRFAKTQVYSELYSFSQPIRKALCNEDQKAEKAALSKV